MYPTSCRRRLMWVSARGGRPPDAPLRLRTRTASPPRVSRVTRAGVAVPALLMLSALPALTQPPAAAATASMRAVSTLRYAHHVPQAAATTPDVEKLRPELLRRLNDLRAATGTPPRRLPPALHPPARQHAD